MTEAIRIGDDPTTLRQGVDLFAPPTSEERSSTNPLEELRAALSAPVETPTTTLRVPSRPGVTLRFRCDIDADKRKAWQRRSTSKSRRGGAGRDEVDEMLFAMLVLANTHEAVQFNGVDAHDEEDTPLTFAHAQLWDMVGARDPQDCIRKLFANDAHVLLASGDVLIASGFDDDLDADPTAG